MPYAPWNAGGYYPFTYGRTTQTPQNMPGGSGGPPATTLPGYNVNPQPTSGQGPYGQVPGPIAVPPSTWQQATGAVPALGNTSQLTNNIMSELHGDINPQALKNMQDAAAAYGIQSGMPGSNAIPGTLLFNKNLRNIGLDTLAVQRQGQQDYTGLLNAVGGQQTPQALAAEIAAHNAQLGAAPNPQQAAQQQLANYLAGLGLGQRRATPNLGGGGYSNPSGGTGQYAGPSALGFGFGSLGQQGGADTRFSNTSAIPHYPSPSNPILDSDFGFGTQGGYNPISDLDFGYGGGGGYNPITDTDFGYGGGGYGGYDQTASSAFDPNMTNEDYFYLQ